jgi:lipopolysaccharide/colanic/teichoic acid biosynthesis glycosyltransferase
MKLYRIFFKRFFDFGISLLSLIGLSPVLLVVTILLHFANKGAGAYFTQDRPGKYGKIFKVIKFKTMTDERDENGELLPDEARLTKVGRFVRSTSIDELPQLINVLKGDMSLIDRDRCLCSTCRFIVKNRPVVMRCVLVYPAGHSVMVAMPSVGRRGEVQT